MMMKYVLLLLLILIFVSGRCTALSINQHCDQTQEIGEGQSAIWTFTLFNDEPEPLSITIEYSETIFPINGSPTSGYLYPFQSMEGSYRIGPCCEINDTIEIESSYNITSEGDFLGTSGETKVDVILIVHKEAESESSTGILVHDEDYSTVIIATTFFSLLIVFWKRYFFIKIIFPLYHKITHAELTDNGKRKVIMELLQEHCNGMTVSDICSVKDYRRTTTRYHLSILREYGYIYYGYNNKYYPFTSAPINDIPLEAAIRNLIVENPNMKKTDIARRLGISKQLLHYYIIKDEQQQHV